MLLSLSLTDFQTFFSTDVVKYQDQNDNSGNNQNGSYSPLALQRWLQVTLPLTALSTQIHARERYQANYRSSSRGLGDV